MAGVNFLPIQAGTGNPSPTNVRPITPGLSITGIGDIYGGYLDVANGCVVEDKTKITATSVTDILGAYHTSDGGWAFTILQYGSNFKRGGYAISTINIVGIYASQLVNGFCKVEGNAPIFILMDYDSGLSASSSKEEIIAAFNSFISANNVAAIYELATPITYPLTTAQLTEAMQKLKVPSAPAQALHRRLVNTPHPVTTTPASVASFDTDMVGKLKSAKFGFLPVQDLHGYANPWPAGGGKNLLNVTTTSDTINGVTFTVNPDGTVLVNGTATAEAVFILNNDVGLGVGTYIGSGAPNGTGTSYVIQAKVDGIYKNIFASQQLDVSTGITTVLIDVKSGVNVNNVTLKPMICLSTASEPSIFAPYSNICPISGWDGVTALRVGKNLFNKDATPVQSGKYIDSTTSVGSEPVYTTYSPYNVYAIPVKPNTTYCISNIKANTPVACLINASGIVTYARQNNGGTAGTTWSITTGNDDVSLLLSVAVYGDNDCDDVLQVELGSTATAYTPYTGSTYPVTWQSAGTIYGGYVDVCRGVLTVDRHIIDLDADIAGWYYQSANTRFWTDAISSTVKRSTGDWSAPFICSAYKSMAWNSTQDNFITMANSNGRVFLKDTRYTTVEALREALVGVKLCYELATPITYAITPTIIKSLKGANNLWSNANGDAEATYWTHTGVVNYLRGITWTDGYSIGPDGAVSTNAYFKISGLITLPPGQYTFTAINLDANYSRTARIHGYTSDGTWQSQLAEQVVQPNSSYTMTFTVTTSTPKIQISLVSASSNAKLIRT